MRLKLHLRFEQPLLFRGFLPEDDSNAIRITLEDGRQIALYISDRQAQLSPYDIVPSDIEKLKQSESTINCLGLTLEMQIPDPSPGVLTALEEDDPQMEGHPLVEEVFDLALRARNGVVEYLRNVEKQYWLRPIVAGTYDHLHFLIDTDAQWIDRQGNWRPLPRSRPMADFPTETTISGPDVILGHSTAITQDRWVTSATAFLRRFIESGYGAKKVDALVASAYSLLEQMDTSLAVVEAVRALELFVKSTFPKVVHRWTHAQHFDLQEADIDSLFKKAGLEAVSLLVFGLVGQGMGLDADIAKALREAVALRNSILHSGAENVAFSDANRCVSAIHKAVEMLRKAA